MQTGSWESKLVVIISSEVLLYLNSIIRSKLRGEREGSYLCAPFLQEKRGGGGQPTVTCKDTGAWVQIPKFTTHQVHDLRQTT